MIIHAKSGRKLRYPDAALLEEYINAYFEKCKETSTLPTKGGLALWLGLTREAMSDYERRAFFCDAIKKAYARVGEA